MSEIRENSVKRLGAVLSLIGFLEKADFPYPDIKDVLGKIKELLQTRKDALASLSSETNPQAMKAICRESLDTVFHCLPLVGFLTRATDVRNPFELYDAMRRLVSQVLPPEQSGSAQLIISSEWDYSPYTWVLPSELGLQNVVFIGLPASESGNALAIPLAGHELGHNVWRTYNMGTKYSEEVRATMQEVIELELFDEYDKMFPEISEPEHVSTVLGAATWSECWQWGLSQVEEIFCDYFGILVFRSSFLQSFSYLLAPGNPVRNVHYPDNLERVDAHIYAAERANVVPPEGYREAFEGTGEAWSEKANLWLKTTALVCKRLWPTLYSDAKRIVKETAVDRSSESEIEEIRRCFELGVPTKGAAELTNIVQAGWEFYKNQYGSWRESYPFMGSGDQRYSGMLSDIIFKSIEVSEINPTVVENPGQ